MNYKRLKVFLIVTSILLLSGCGGKEAVKRDILKNVKPVEVTLSNIICEDEFAGTISPADQAGVVPKIPGKVTQVFVDIGSKVNKGDLLFTLDSSDADKQLQQAEAGYKVAETNLNRVQGSAYTQALLQAQSAYDQAKINYDDAKVNYDRIKKLFDASAASKKELEGVEIRLDLTKQQLETAQSNLEVFKSMAGPDSFQGAQAQLNQAAASVQLIQSQLDNTRVFAPISGIVSKKNVNVGEGVSAASPAVVIVNSDELTAEFNIPEKLINKLAVGQKILVFIDSLDNKSFDGLVTNISPMADSKTHDYKIKIKMLLNSSEVKPGMFAKIKMIVDSKSNVITVPNQAIMNENGLQFVFVVNNNKLTKQQIKTGLSNEKMTQVTEGLSEGNLLIIEGLSFLNDGENVNVIQ